MKRQRPSCGLFFAVATLMALAVAPAYAGNDCGCAAPAPPSCGYAPPCGCEAAPTCYCRRHCGHHGHHRRAPAKWAAQPPAGPVVASMAAPSFNTLSSVNFVAASDLNFVRPVSLVQLSAAAPAAAPAATPESSCQGNAARIRDLEERIDLLQDRLNKVQGNVAEQTEILREIAARIKSMPMSALPQ